MSLLEASIYVHFRHPTIRCIYFVASKFDVFCYFKSVTQKESSVQTVVTRIQTEANREEFIDILCAYLLLIPRFLEKMMLHRCSFRPFGLGN